MRENSYNQLWEIILRFQINDEYIKEMCLKDYKMNWSLIGENSSDVKITKSILTMLVFLSSRTKFRILYTLKLFWNKSIFSIFVHKNRH